MNDERLAYKVEVYEENTSNLFFKCDYLSEFAKRFERSIKHSYNTLNRILSGQRDTFFYDGKYYNCRFFEKEKEVIHEDNEIWRLIDGFNRYQVSNLGRFRKKLKSGKFRYLSPYVKNNRKNSRYYAIKLNGIELSAAKLVLKTFSIMPTPNHVVYFIDKRSENIALTNLTWVSMKQHGHYTGGRNSKAMPVILYNKNGTPIKMFSSSRSAAKELNCSYQTILDICHKRVKKTPLVNVAFQRS